jgi:hypothetical protein
MKVDAVVSCFIDDQPRFHLQALTWLHSLAGSGVEGVQIMLHHAADLPATLLDTARSMSAQCIRVSRFGDGPAAYCNKLQQFDAVLGSRCDYVILSDADLYFLEPVRDLCRGDPASARIVDLANPPELALLTLLASAGWKNQALDSSPWFAPEARTHRFNCNGGLYVFARPLLAELQVRWRHWSAFCLGRRDVLGDSLMHADQLGFMLAMIECGVDLAPLAPHANVPTHLPADRYSEPLPRASSLHYHARVDADGRLQRNGAADIDRHVDEANRRLAAVRVATTD